MVAANDLFAFTSDNAPLLPLNFPPVGNSARARHIKSPRYINYDVGSAVLNRLNWLYDHPKVCRPPCTLIYSDTNNGKSYLAKKFVRDHEAVDDSPEYGKHPVLFVDSPPGADLNGFYDAILRSLNAPYKSSARSPAKWDQLLQLLKAVGTKVLILDEVNNYLYGKVDQRSLILNSMKCLSNELQIPVVAVGTPDSVRVFQTDQQLGNRFEPMGIPRWKVSKEYALFISRFVSCLDLKHESDFHSKELVGRIHTMAEGLTGETCKLLERAAELAVEMNREVIDMTTLDNVQWVMPSERRRAAR